MPRIARFASTEIAMYFADHPPPHFHVLGRDGAAQVEIETLEVIATSGRIDLRRGAGLGGGASRRIAGALGSTEWRPLMAIGKLTSLAVVGPNALELAWDDGHVAKVDLGEVIAEHTGLKSIRAARAFAKAAISRDGWSVEWPGDIDFGSPQLRRWADEQSGEAMPATDFRKWMEAYELTLDGAAAALGLSRRMIAYYASGEKEIPKTVLLATVGYRARKRAGRKRVGVAEEGATFRGKRRKRQ